MNVFTKLAQSGHLLTHDRDSNILQQLKLDDLIETDFIPFKSIGTLKSLVDAFTASNKCVYPVIDNENNLLGVIYLENLKHMLFQTDRKEALVWFKL
jgi:CIC family chloride channel protein